MSGSTPNTGRDDSLKVVVGIIRNDAGEVLLTRRQAGRHQSGKWEFPGGKREADEDPQQALARELLEELGIEAEKFQPRIRVPYRYPDLSVCLDVYDVEMYSGVPYGREGQAMKWVPLTHLDRFRFPAANQPILTSLKLPDRYAISCATQLGDKKFLSLLDRKFREGLQILQLREPGMTATDFRDLAKQCVELAHSHQRKILLNTNDMELVVDLGANGVHLSSRMLMSLTDRPLPESLLVAASCHDEREVKKAQEINSSFIVLSPVKATRSHPDSFPIGWERFKSIVSRCAIPVYALGGMDVCDIDQARRCGGQGVAVMGAAWRDA